MKGNWPALAGLMLVVGVGLAPSAWGWGCTGHQVVAVLAEEHLNPHARDMVAQILAAGPIDPALRRYCGANTLDAFADSSTWADDQHRQHDQIHERQGEIRKIVGPEHLHERHQHGADQRTEKAAHAADDHDDERVDHRVGRHAKRRV